MKKFISSLKLLAFLSVSAHSTTTHFLYVVEENDIKIARYANVDSSTTTNTITIDKKLPLNRYNSWALNLHDNGTIEFSAANVLNEIETISAQNVTSFEYDVMINALEVQINPNRDDAIALLPVVLGRLIHAENFNDLQEFLLISDSNFEIFKNFFAKIQDLDFKKHEDAIEIAIVEAKRMPAIWRVSKIATTMVPIILSSVGATLLLKSYEEASAIINGMAYFFVLLGFCVLDYFREEIFSKQIGIEANVNQFNSMKRLMPYYVISEEEGQNQKIEMIKNVIKDRNQEIGVIMKALWKIIYDNL